MDGLGNGIEHCVPVTPGSGRELDLYFFLLYIIGSARAETDKCLQIKMLSTYSTGEESESVKNE